jgi:chromosome partitioning protein
MRTIAIANHKGGVGKSATTEHLAWLFANRYGLRVLMIDMDAQGSLTEAMGVTDAEGASMAEVLGGSDHPTKKMKAILRDLGGGLFLAPADIAMARSEHALASRPLGREQVLAKALESIEGQFDLCFIDCPPSLGQLTFNALFASEAVIIPTGPTAKDLRGLPELEAAQAQGALRLFQTRIGRSVKVSESEELGISLFEYAGRNPRAAEYESLAQEVAECLKLDVSAVVA